MKTNAIIVGALIVSNFWAGIHSARAAGKPGSASTLIRADFDDSLNPDNTPKYRIRSDGNASSCVAAAGYDYVAVQDDLDPSSGVCSGDTTSTLINGGQDYFLRTVVNQSPCPNRWLVLDFTETQAGSTCPGLDSTIAGYPGWGAGCVFENVDPCVDFVAVRFFAYNAFKAGATASVDIVIDAPDLITTKSGPKTQWNAKYELAFQNALPTTQTLVGSTVTKSDLNTGGTAPADLWALNPKTGVRQTHLGTYNMPFQLTLVRAP